MDLKIINSIGLTNLQQDTGRANWDRLAGSFRDLLSSVQQGDLPSAQKALHSLADSSGVDVNGLFGQPASHPGSRSVGGAAPAVGDSGARATQVMTSAPIGTPDNPYTNETITPLEAWLGMGQPIDPVYFAQRQAQAAADQARMGCSSVPTTMSAREQQLHDQGVAAFNYMQSKGMNPYDYMGGNGGPAGAPGSGPCVFTKV